MKETRMIDICQNVKLEKTKLREVLLSCLRKLFIVVLLRMKVN